MEGKDFSYTNNQVDDGKESDTLGRMILKSVRRNHVKAVAILLDRVIFCNCSFVNGFEIENDITMAGTRPEAGGTLVTKNYTEDTGKFVRQHSTSALGGEDESNDIILNPNRGGEITESLPQSVYSKQEGLTKHYLTAVDDIEQNESVEQSVKCILSQRRSILELSSCVEHDMVRKIRGAKELNEQLMDEKHDQNTKELENDHDFKLWNTQNFALTRMCTNQKESTAKQYRMIKDKLQCKPQFQFLRSNFEKSNNYKALILAAQIGNAEIIQLFLAKGFNIDDPHGFECECTNCLADPLSKSVLLIEIYKAITNPVWMSLTSDDPFQKAFQYSMTCGKLAKMDDAYEKVYHKLDQQCRQYCLDLLDQCKTTREQLIIMNMGEENKDDSKVVISSSLKFVHMAIDYKQKEVVSHPIPQHLLTSLVFDSFPKWRVGGPAYRVLFIMMFSLLYPLTTVTYILFPCSKLGKIAKRPLIKFINGSASFAYFLGFLAWLSTSPRLGIRGGGAPTILESVIFIWLVSLLFAELGQLISAGYRRYFSSGWNWIDISMIVLMLGGYVIWILLKFVFVDVNNRDKANLISFADGLFASGIVLSFFRLVYLCQITRFLGLLQLCLGRMVQVIFQFAFISCVVLWSFSAGMVFLYYASPSFTGQRSNAGFFTNPTNKSDVKRFLSGGFDGLPATVVTLAWASMNMIGLESLKGFDDGSVTHLWSALLFTLYHGVSMIVLLNMLIAMMSNSYQQIENNIEVEHKFARTKLWVDYIGDSNILPSPFNLIPSFPSLVSFFKLLKNTIYNRFCAKTKNYAEEEKKRFADNNYKITVRKLVRRYLKATYNIHLDNKMRSKGAAEKDDQFLSKVRKFLEEYSKSQDKTCGGICKGLRKTRDSGVDLTITEPNVDETILSPKVHPLSEEDQEI